MPVKRQADSRDEGKEMKTAIGTVIRRAGKTRVFLADDHEIFRIGLRTVLGHVPEIEVAGESAAGPGLLDRIKAASPDIVLLDLSPGQPGAFDTFETIRDRFPSLRVLVLTGLDVPIPAADACARKLDGYINKECSGDFLRTAIKMVGLGGSVWQPGLLYCPTGTGLPGSHSPGGQGSDEAARLSPRETLMLSLLAGGKTNKQIALELKLAQVTVKKALQGLFAKLGVSNRTQAAMKASQLGLL